MTDAWDSRLTEARNPRTAGIDRADVAGVVSMIQAEDATVHEAVAREAEALVELIERVVERLERGGRLLYIGAGTSGRLGVMDAAECPPTFGTDPGLVRGVIAGGEEALLRSIEGAEDDREAGRRDVAELAIGPDDFVIGIASSGTTPYVRAALEEAASRDAGVGFLSCTEPPAAMRALADVLVTPRVGPEVIAGSTRLKAGTATKLVLNTLTTAVMIRLGKVYGNLMVDLRAVSVKLVERSLRMVRHLLETDETDARELLLSAGGSVKTALVMRRVGTDRGLAERLLDAHGGWLAEALERYPPGSSIPYYESFPDTAGPEGSSRLLRRLATAPDRWRRAIERSEKADEEGRIRPSGWSDAQHLAHLAAFEAEVVTRRIAAILDEEEPEFADWSPSDPADATSRTPVQWIEKLATLRSTTLERLDPEAPAPWERTARLGEERFNLHQFLRGIAQHDDAHALRIAERVHTALTGPTPAGAGETPEPTSDATA